MDTVGAAALATATARGARGAGGRALAHWLPATLVALLWVHTLCERPAQLAAAARSSWSLGAAMVVGSLVAGSTALGSGVVAFPVSLVLQLDASEARDVAVLAERRHERGGLPALPHARHLHADPAAAFLLWGSVGIVAGLHAAPAPRWMQLAYTIVVAQYAMCHAAAEWHERAAAAATPPCRDGRRRGGRGARAAERPPRWRWWQGGRRGDQGGDDDGQPKARSERPGPCGRDGRRGPGGVRRPGRPAHGVHRVRAGHCARRLWRRAPAATGRAPCREGTDTAAAIRPNPADAARRVGRRHGRWVGRVCRRAPAVGAPADGGHLGGVGVRVGGRRLRRRRAPCSSGRGTSGSFAGCSTPWRPGRPSRLARSRFATTSSRGGLWSRPRCRRSWRCPLRTVGRHDLFEQTLQGATLSLVTSDFFYICLQGSPGAPSL